MTTKLTSVFFLLALSASAQKFDRADLSKAPAAPDYADIQSWICLPSKEDAADQVPGKGNLRDQQDGAEVDVFFVYPTIYSKRQKPTNPWNADVFDEKLTEQIAKTTIKNQATVFNGSARIYAPLYRQAHINVFSTEDLLLKQEALDIAYTDVKTAFLHYMEQFNDGRPVIIASHSQGTLHAARLMKELWDGTPLQGQLVAGYLVGMPLAVDLFESIEPCTSEGQTGCWVSWNTYARGWYPESFEVRYQNALSTNPINWKVDQTYAPASKNLGGVLRNYKNLRASVNDAQNHRGVLWISKPRFFGNFLMNWKRYHVADYNLFYMNIRENVALRVANYLSQ